MNFLNLERAFRWKKERGWDTLYIACDFHDTIFAGKYATDQELELAPGAEEVLKWATDREDIRLIAFTCSYARDFNRVNRWLGEKGIHFDYLNENPECGDTSLASFQRKFYFNVLIDDKCGWIAETDWIWMKDELKRLGEWDIKF